MTSAREGEAKPRRGTRLQQALRSLRLAARGAWDRHDSLRRALDGIGLGVWEIDFATGEQHWSAAQFRIFGLPPTADGSATFAMWRERIHPDDAPRVLHAWEQMHSQHRLFEAEFRLYAAGGGEERWVSSYGHIERTGAGDAGRVIGVTLDVTATKRSEARQKLLAREYDHRIRNLLALVQSLAAQTWRMAPSPEDFHTALTERLRALAAAHALLGDATGSTSLRTLVEQVLAPYRGDSARPRVAVEGPPVGIPARTAISVAMALHELATNAVKYGALSGESGRVAIRWDAASPDHGVIRLEWQESGGPPVQPPMRRGFGSRLLEHGLAVELAEVRLRFDPEGVRCLLAFEADGAPPPLRG